MKSPEGEHSNNSSDTDDLDEASSQPEDTLNIPLNPSLLALLQAHEVIVHLREKALLITQLMPMIEATPLSMPHAGFDKWKQLLSDLVDLEQRSGSMLECSNLSRQLLFWLFKDLINVQGRWMVYRTQEATGRVDSRLSLELLRILGNRAEEVRKASMNKAMEELGVHDDDKWFNDAILRIRVLLTRQRS